MNRASAPIEFWTHHPCKSTYRANTVHQTIQIQIQFWFPSAFIAHTMNALQRIFQYWKNWTSPFSSSRTQNTMRYIKQKWNIWLINDCQSSNHRIESTSPQCSSQKHLSWSAHGCDHVSKVISSSASILSRHEICQKFYTARFSG